MIELIPAQLRLAASVGFGARFRVKSLERILAAMIATRAEFGSMGEDAEQMIQGPLFSADTELRRDVERRRFRQQAVRAARETCYYRELFERIGLDPRRLEWEDIQMVPLTTKADLRERPDDFTRERGRPTLRALTTGTTSAPTAVHYSEHELAAVSAMGAINFVSSGQVSAEDIVQVSISSRAPVGLQTFGRACGRVGAAVHGAGLIDPSHGLALLAEQRSIPGKKRQVSILSTHPSYLGELVERGIAEGYGRSDFGLERIFVSGEIATAGLLSRARRLFGDVEFTETWSSTEIFPHGGVVCTAGHMHFAPATGLTEIRSLSGDGIARPGEPGTIVATPFPPFREATIVLRFETGDVVRQLDSTPTCELPNVQATTPIQGKLATSIEHAHGWTFQRDVAEALEHCDAVPLPARYAFGRSGDGVAVDVVVRGDRHATERQLRDHLEGNRVPLTSLHLLDDPRSIRRAASLRCDLKETVFAPTVGRSPRAQGRRVA